MEFILVVLGAIVCFYCGVVWGKFLVINKVVNSLNENELRQLEELLKRLEKVTDESLAQANAQVQVPVTTKTLHQEVINGQTFLYDGGTFVCQAEYLDHAVTTYRRDNKYVDDIVVTSESGERRFDHHSGDKIGLQ